jgi:hypothetical protein
MKEFILLGVLLCLCGCVPLYYRSYDEGYPGLRQRLDEAAQTNAAMHVIVVHGIGNHSPGYSAPLAGAMARLLQLVKQTDSPPAPLVSSKGVTNWLRESSYGGEGRRMIFHEVTWTPTTIGIKANAFLKDQTLNAHRVLVNRDLKTNLMDEALPDAVLYLNPTFRGAMQDPILQTMQRVGGLANSNDVIVLVAESLGSKMVFDTAVAYDTDLQVQHFAERTTDIIMLANQLPLLHLGTGTNLEADASQAPETGAKQFLRMMRTHKQNRIDKERKAGNPRQAAIRVVAATDPNDLLSYPLSQRDVIPDDVTGGSVTITVGNIYSHNTGAILFIFANPEAAHDNYGQNDWLLRSLVFGYPNHSP